MLDACRQDDLPDLHADSKRLPQFLLPDTDYTTLDKWCPDILRIVGLPPAPTEAQIHDAVQNKQNYTLQLVEVGYCYDTNWQKKDAQKLMQHNSLLNALTLAGWRIDADARTLTLGVCGTVYLSGAEALQNLGLKRTQTSTLLTKLNTHAVQAAHTITSARRRLERGRCAVGVG